MHDHALTVIGVPHRITKVRVSGLHSKSKRRPRPGYGTQDELVRLPHGLEDPGNRGAETPGDPGLLGVVGAWCVDLLPCSGSGPEDRA